MAIKPKFEGWYYKQQANGKTLAVIPGRSSTCAFILVVTDKTSYNIPFKLSEYRKGKILKIGNNLFSSNGIRLRINTKNISIHGDLKYQNLTPINGDIMGLFRFFPMECRHGIVSMKHDVAGKIEINGATWDFTNGTGYIETDSGVSFPEKYTWVQSNNFKQNCSIMAAVAKIPFAGFSFWGCICVVWINGKEYRLATYKGAKIRRVQHNLIELRQGKYRLIVKTNQHQAHKLAAPKLGVMSRIIKESASCPAKFLFTKGNKVLFAGTSQHASYEYEF